jgi:hypothetical protein
MATSSALYAGSGYAQAIGEHEQRRPGEADTLHPLVRDR